MSCTQVIYLCFVLMMFIKEKPKLTLLEPPGFGDFRKKTAVFGCFTNALAPLPIALESCSAAQTDRQSSRLHSKINFLLGVRFFCEWRHKWTFRTPWPTSPGPGGQPLGVSISLKFLLETRLQSESFDTLDDQLGLLVQKLWSKIVKIFD